MATVIRQPFAPLDGARLKSLTSIKNIQNSIPTQPVKRKAPAVLDESDDDVENIEPFVFSKRSKGVDGDSSYKSFAKPSFTLTKAASTPSLLAAKDALSPPSNKPLSSRQRSILKPKSPASRLSVKSTASSPLTAPAGRSPTRSPKRMGILSRRRRTQRVDPPSLGLGVTVPFSLDDALKGTIPSYSGGLRGSSSSADQSLQNSSWFFDIHEDTPEQEMTNLLQHSTCTLDISSDEESEGRARRDRAKGLDKENIPPPDDVSQTSARSARSAADIDDMDIEKQRGPLAKMNVADLYAGCCDSTGIFLVFGDEEETETVIDGADPSAETEAQPAQREQRNLLEPSQHDSLESPRVNLTDVEAVSVENIMGNNDREAKATVLESIEGAGESFEIWESSSAKDECEAPTSAAHASAEEVPQAVPVVVC